MHMKAREFNNWNSVATDADAGENDDATEFDLGVEGIDRKLVSLRIGNETNVIGGDETLDAYTYHPSHVVTRLHRAPRGIGHTNRLASILVEKPKGGNDYVGGLKLFVGFFIITPFVFWILFLFTAKLKHILVHRIREKESKTRAQLPTPKTLTLDDPNAKTPSPKPKGQTDKKIIPVTSWVAGGDIIDMIELSRAGVSRKVRKRLVMRSWKIQSTFLSVSILIPVLSVVLLECGWKPLEAAMQEIQELNGEVENLAYRGRDAVDRLERYKQELFADNELVRSILEYSYDNANEQDQKSWKEDGESRSRNDYQEFIDHNNENRRAQFFAPEQATTVPSTFTSNFDSEFFFPWAEITTPPLGQISDDINDVGDPFFKNDEEKTNVKSNVQTSASVEGFLNSSSFSSRAHGIFTEDWCPDAIRLMETEEFNYWADSIDYLTMKTKSIYQIFESLEGSFLPTESSPSLWGDARSSENAYSTFDFVTDTTNYVDESIDWFLANDWLLKLLVLVLNVVNGLLLANVYFFSKNNVIHQPTRLYVAYVLIPMFIFATISVVIVTVAASVAVLVNSDFCSGGSGVGSPQGTIEDFILTLKEQQQVNSEDPQEVLGLVYDAVDYYWTGCLSENPLGFFEDFSDEVDEAAARINDFTLLLKNADAVTNGIETQVKQTGPSPQSVLDKACLRDMSFLAPSVLDMKRQIDQIRTNIHKLSDTMSCAQVSPLFRRISHGAVCVESPQGLAALWGTSFGISILCFILLTVRAALYNSVKYKKRRPTKPRRIVEKEFDEYKAFMGKYYGEEATKKWNIDGIPLPPTKLEFEFAEDLELKGTFDTAKSSKESGDNSFEDGGSEHAGIFIRKMESDDSSYGSSYDSECSDDDKSSDSDSNDGDDLSSAIGSFLSETKSIAMQTIHSLRNVKSLLSTSKRKKNPPSHVGNSNLVLGNPDLDDSSEEDAMDYGNEVFFSQKVEKGCDVGMDCSDVKSEANSISDDSLYLPTPTSQQEKNMNAPTHAAELRKKSILSLLKDHYFSDEDEQEDELLASHSLTRAKKLRTPTNPISSVSPSAPRKPLAYLARTLYTGKHEDGNYTEEELTSLVQPKQLANLNSFRSKRGQDSSRYRDNNTGVARGKRSSARR